MKVDWQNNLWGQELIVYANPEERNKTFHWERFKRGSSGDRLSFCLSKSQVYPVEVKAGKTGRLKSLKYLKKKCEIKSRFDIQSFHYLP